MKLRKTLAVVFCMMLVMSCLLITASAASASNANIIVVADKTEVEAGETVTFSVVLVNADATPEGVYSYDAKIAISGGLTLVEGSVKAVANEGFYAPVFNSDLRCMSTGYNAEGNNGKGYNKGNLTLGTFQCKVESEGTATASAVIFTENGYSEALDMVVNVVTTGVGGSATVKIAHEHSWGDWYVVTEPTCTEDGLKARDCACGERETEVIPAIGHDWVWHVETETCCCAPGYEVQICANCGVRGEGREIPALEHLPGEAVKENYIAPTQTEDGGYDLVVYCQRECCKAELSREHHVIPALGYDDEPNTGDFTVALGMVMIVVMMIPCLLVGKFRAVK